jgi:cytochrome c2
LPTNLAYAATRFSSAELYWVLKHGIKMTAMPAWQFRFSESDLWAVVAFMQQLRLISPAEYASRVRDSADVRMIESAPDERIAFATGDAVRGKTALQQYACTTCHDIPGIVGDHAPVGPPLARIATRQYLAGVVPNTPENMVQWLRTPQKIDPLTAMPDLYVSERDAIDMAAYLYTLR